MEIIAKTNKSRAIKSYIKKLPKLLAKDYGKRKKYTPQQVRSTIHRSKLNNQYVCYAIAIYTDRVAFDLFHQENGETCDYDAMRSEIADKYFSGNANFEIEEVASVSSSYGGGFDDGGFSDTGGDGGGSD